MSDLLTVILRAWHVLFPMLGRDTADYVNADTLLHYRRAGYRGGQR